MFAKDRRFKLPVTGAVLAGLIATAALAADAPAPATAPDATCPPGHHRGDIDLSKMDARAAKAFESADADGDGKITQAEFLAAKPPHGRAGGPGPGMHHGSGMGHHGPDGDWMTQARETFQADLYKALDADKNGQLSEAEFSKAWETARTMMKTQMFTKLDKNGDGVLTKDEFPSFAAKMTAMDANGDGTVTRDEMKAARAARGAQTPSSPTPTN